MKEIFLKDLHKCVFSGDDLKRENVDDEFLQNKLEKDGAS